MGGLIYQLKSVRKDKFCIMSFLLPLIVAFILNFIGAIDFSTLSEFHFGVIQDNLPAGTISWLERYGTNVIKLVAIFLWLDSIAGV